MNKFTTVDEYIAQSPKEYQPMLQQLRETIKSVAPTAEEKISYGMPYYNYKGRLVYFLLAKNHIGIYLPTPTVEQHAKELKNYKTAKATVHFELDKPLPIALIKKLVKARLKINESQHLIK